MKIGINCGHTLIGPGSGAVGIINESLEARNVGNALIELLKNNGNEVINCTIDQADTQNAYLAECVKLANRQDLDYFISIHFNAGGGKGTEIYTYKGNEYTEALNICENITGLGFNNRGIKDGSRMYVIRKTKAKSMLIEICFVDSDDANRYLDIGAVKFAEAIYKGIVYNNQIKTEYDEWIARLQQELNNQFQCNLVVDGLNSSMLLDVCPTIKVNACSNITKLIQERLNSVGFNLEEDGIFGQKTKRAIIVFQQNRNLQQDGIVGKNTWNYLLSGKKY